ncbi:MAG TPA: hypothetical protein VMU94_17670 [Streptosporangiaceae bacterium]|nr:hypothetical protein [Streptosporangiaceae bacterium]
MLRASPPAWTHFLPGYGGFRVLTSATLTPSFSQPGSLLVALAWLAAATAVATVMFHNLRIAGRGRSRTGTQVLTPSRT